MFLYNRHDCLLPDESHNLAGEYTFYNSLPEFLIVIRLQLLYCHIVLPGNHRDRLTDFFLRSLHLFQFHDLIDGRLISQGCLGIGEHFLQKILFGGVHKGTVHF